MATITSRTCRILSLSGDTSTLLGYADSGSGKTCQIGDVVVKVHPADRDIPVLLVFHNVQINDDDKENESLAIPFHFWSHGARCCIRPPSYGGACGLTIDDNFFPFQWDGEKVYFNISQPSDNDLFHLEWFEANSPNPDNQIVPYNIRRNRNRQKETPGDIPLHEWRKRLAMLPADVVRKTLENTTHFYLNAEIENRQDPRRSLKSQRPGLRVKRRNEVVATDTYFPSVKSAQGHTCSQFFVGQQSNRWDTFPLKSEHQNYQALQDLGRTYGVPDAIRSDNAQSETDKEWTEWCRKYCCDQQTTIRDSPWMNFAERNIGTLGAMVRNCHRAFHVPPQYHNWTQKWCCDCHNIASNRQLGWLSPDSIHFGHTPDISPFRFHLWEPIWYFEKGAKMPIDTWKPGRWLGFAHQAGDSFSYWIRTERTTGRDAYLIRTDVKTRRKNIGTDQEYVNDDIEQADFILAFKNHAGNIISDDALETIWEDDMEPSQSDDLPATGEPGPDPQEIQHEDPYPGETPLFDEHDPGDLSDLYAQFQMEEDEDDFEFEKIVDHRFQDGVLLLKARYQGQSSGENVMEVPFRLLRKDVPLECAKYIRQHVIDSNRRSQGPHTEWANKFIKQHSRATRRLYRIYNIDASMRYQRSRRAKNNRTAATLAFDATHHTANKKKKKARPKEKFGVTVPRSTRHALLLDKAAIGTALEGKWAEAIQKEMKSLDDLKVFQYHPYTTNFDRTEGWQFAPMHMIFDIKHDGRYKARLCVGGNVLDMSGYETFSSTVKDLTVRLLMLTAVQNRLNFITADVGNAFCTAPNVEKVWSKAGVEFGDKAGCKITLKRALYGTRTASRSFHEFLGELLLRMGFQPSRADQDLWWKKSPDYEGYDYIATHVDDIICAARDPSTYMSQIEQEFKLRDLTDTPDYYLGNDLTRLNDGNFHVSTKRYTKEVLRKYQSEFGSIRKQQIPMKPGTHPETDTSNFLDPGGIKRFQRIIGIGQWLIVSGRFDICYAVSSLSRFSSAPREGHLAMAEHILGYLRKYPRRGYIVNPRSPDIDPEYENVEVKCDFGHQYSYFKEDLDERFPTPLLAELDINVFVDADHGHDKTTGRSISGLIITVGSTPIIWRSKRQSCVQTSTFGAEFTALKLAVEETVAIRYHMRSMGIKVSTASAIWVDNMSVILNATKPGSPLNKKSIALAYHFVREHQANHVVSVRKIASTENFSDPFTKALPNDAHHGFFGELLSNGGRPSNNK